MEIEAKFVATAQILDKILSLRGQKLGGYEISQPNMSLFIDRYFDTDDLILYRQAASLRLRQKWRQYPVVEPHDVISKFQAKTSPQQNGSIYTRQEIIGKELRKDEAAGYLTLINSSNLDDEAIIFARQKMGIGKADLQYKLHVHDKRTRLYFLQDDKAYFELSLDEIIYSLPKDEERLLRNFECELEIIATETDADVLSEFEKLTKILQKTYQLQVSKKNKYLQGMDLLRSAP